MLSLNSISFQGVEIQCIGHFKLLFCLLRLESYKKLQEMTLNVLVNVTGSKECIDDISASQVFHFLLQSIYSLPEQRSISLAVLNSLVGDTRLVKECLAQGKTDMDIRGLICHHRHRVLFIFQMACCAW